MKVNFPTWGILQSVFWICLFSLSTHFYSASSNNMLMSNTFPQYITRSVLRLDGLWDFAFMEKCRDPLKPDLAKVIYTDRLAVPGVFDAMPQYAGKRGTAFYRTFVTAPANARMLLKSGGLGMWGAFFWDGQFIGLQDLPYSGMEFEFNSGDGSRHELVAVIDNRFDFKRQPLLSQNYDYYCFGGIFRSIELHQLPPLAIDRAQIKTVSLKGEIEIAVKLTGEHHKKVDITYQIDDGEAVKLSCSVFHEIATFNATVPDPSIWSTTSPALHTIAITVGDDTVVERFGLRTVEAKNGRILLNGEPLKLRGYCRHESHPEFGPALPLQIVLEDIQLLKKTGCNFVRGSHYPQDQRFLNLCDENGILVWEESVGWGDRENHLLDPAFQEAQLRQLPWMVKNSFNHPCVILWGFLNEGDSSLQGDGRKLYEDMIGTLRKLDSTRLITYASNAYTKDINFDLVDVVSLNAYPGWYAANQETMRPLGEIRPKFNHFIKFLHDSGFDDKPFIISEVGAGAIYGWRDRLRAHWSEEYQADYLDEVLTYFDETPRIAGIALWQFIDCRTYASSRALGRPRAFNNKGLFDEYRRPKLAFDVVSKHFNKP